MLCVCARTAAACLCKSRIEANVPSLGVEPRLSERERHRERERERESQTRTRTHTHTHTETDRETETEAITRAFAGSLWGLNSAFWPKEKRRRIGGAGSSSSAQVDEALHVRSFWIRVQDSGFKLHG